MDDLSESLGRIKGLMKEATKEEIQTRRRRRHSTTWAALCGLKWEREQGRYAAVPALIEACERLAKGIQEIAEPDAESDVHTVKEQIRNANRKILARAALSEAAQVLRGERLARLEEKRGR